MSKEDETIWVSRVIDDTRSVKFFTSDLFEDDANKASETTKQNEKGIPLPADLFPKEIFVMYKGKRYKKLPAIFNASGFWVVSSACADVLRQFDLGDGALYPTKLFQHDRTTPVEGEYFCLNFGNQKQAVVPEYSPKLKKPYPSKDLWRLPTVLDNGDVAVTKTALEGPDLWVDPQIWGGLFLSNPLVQALKSAKLTRPFGLRKCRVIRES